MRKLVPLLSLLALACDEASTEVVDEATVAEAKAQPAGQLIPREVLFGNPERAGVKLSPDGAHISWLAPVDGVLNVWVAPREDLSAAAAVTQDTGRGIRSYMWTYGGDLLYIQDKDGDENWHVYQVDLQSDAEARDLTPMDGVQARIAGLSHQVPDKLVVAINDRDPQLHDLHLIDLETGERELLVQNDQGYLGYELDHDLQVRLAFSATPEGGMEGFKLEEGEWKPFLSIGQVDSMTTYTYLFDKSGEKVYMSDSRERDTAAAVLLDLATDEVQVLAQSPKADLADIMIHPTEYTVQAAAFTHTRKEWTVLDESLQADLDKLKAVSDGEVEVLSRTLDDKSWLVAYLQDAGPVKYYLFDRESGEATFLFTHRPDLEGLPLARMHPVVIPARDGLELVSYLTLPPGSDTQVAGRPDAPVPLILWVHGGPWARDTWGYDPYHQWLANRGYAVLSVNYRGSTGLGKGFTNAGDLQWAAAMHDDLLDAVDWAVGESITTPDKVAIGGGSYGGYATLVGLTFTPDVFACGVDIVGPSSLVTLLESIPPYWKPMISQFYTRVGDLSTEEGKALLEERSPLHKVDAISKPLLIGQGANDPRVKQAEADQIVAAMNTKGLPVTYVIYPDEGHGFARPENRLSFNAVSEAFLAECLGGAAEPVGTAFEGSSIQIPEGAQHIPDLPELAAPAPEEAEEAPAE